MSESIAGVGAANGILAHRLALAGFVPQQDPLADVFSWVASDRFDTETLLDGLGARWETNLAYYKIHTCCR